MKMTAKELLQLKVIDEVIEEPLGGAHHDYDVAADNVKRSIIEHLEQLSKLSSIELRGDRQSKFRVIGTYSEAKAAPNL